MVGGPRSGGPEKRPAFRDQGREGVRGMKNALWISRHRMTAEQLADLERVMGGPIRLTTWPDTVEDLRCLAPAVASADAVCAVLPTELLAELLRMARGRPVLVAASARRPTGAPDKNGDPQFTFVHRGWRQVLRLELEMKTL